MGNRSGRGTCGGAPVKLLDRDPRPLRRTEHLQFPELAVVHWRHGEIPVRRRISLYAPPDALVPPPHRGEASVGWFDQKQEEYHVLTI